MLVNSRKVKFLLFKVMCANMNMITLMCITHYTLVLSCSYLITSSICSIFVEYWCKFSNRPISTQNDLRPSARHLGWSYSVYNPTSPTDLQLRYILCHHKCTLITFNKTDTTSSPDIHVLVYNEQIPVPTVCLCHAHLP